MPGNCRGIAGAAGAAHPLPCLSGRMEAGLWPRTGPDRGLERPLSMVCLGQSPVCQEMSVVRCVRNQ
jgi:hypothetical protein